MVKCSICGKEGLRGVAVCPDCLKRAAVLRESVQRAREIQRQIVSPGMTYGEYMEYLKGGRQQLEEKKQGVHNGKV